MNPNTILCVGYSRLPEGTTMEELFKIFGVGLEIDPLSGIIVKAQTTCATMLGDDFLTQFLVGINIDTEYLNALEQISKRYRGHGGKAILAAAKKAYNEYLNYKDEEKNNPRSS